MSRHTMNRNSKVPYMAVGVLLAFIFSLLLEPLFFVSTGDVFFQRSVSGLRYSFVFLPVFLSIGAILGYLFYLLKQKRG